MFRPWLRVARPDDLSGKVARLVTWVLAAILLIPALLARLPPSWVAAVLGYRIVIRMILILLVLYLLRWFHAVLVSRLPRAPYLWRRTLVVRERGERQDILVDEIEDIEVELRPSPARETLVVELRDGRSFDVCPVHWSGAARLFAVLARKVKRAKRARARAARKQRKRAAAGSG